MKLTLKQIKYELMRLRKLQNNGVKDRKLIKKKQKLRAELWHRLRLGRY